MRAGDDGDRPAPEMCVSDGHCDDKALRILRLRSSGATYRHPRWRSPGAGGNGTGCASAAGRRPRKQAWNFGGNRNLNRFKCVSSGLWKRPIARIAALVTILAAAWPGSVVTPGLAQTAGPAETRGTSTGLALPRFVSLKASRVNLRKGPGVEYPTAWVFRQAGLPVEVVREYEIWREVRDSEGTTGWVIRSLLSARRTAQILPWEVKPDKPRPRVEIRSGQRSTASPVAIVEAGVVADVHDCDGTWCLVSVDAYRGYVEQKKLWGVYTGEIVR